MKFLAVLCIAMQWRKIEMCCLTHLSCSLSLPEHEENMQNGILTFSQDREIWACHLTMELFIIKGNWTVIQRNPAALSSAAVVSQ